MSLKRRIEAVEGEHYAKLEPLERFKLALAAIERDDEGELIMLRETARKATYKMTAFPYRGMWHGILHVAWGAALDILAAGELMFVSWGIEIADQEETSEDNWRHAVKAAERVLTVWEGLGLFCEDIGITITQASIYMPHKGSVEGAVGFAQEILSIEEEVALALAEAHTPLKEPLQEVSAKRTESRAEEAREYAGLLREAWDREIR